MTRSRQVFGGLGGAQTPALNPSGSGGPPDSGACDVPPSPERKGGEVCKGESFEDAEGDGPTQFGDGTPRTDDEDEADDEDEEE